MMLTEQAAREKEKLVFSGSTAFAPVVVAAASEFSRGVCAREISVRHDGSWTGLADVLSGAADAAFVDVDVHDPYDDVAACPVGAFAIAFSGHRSAGITRLTTSQIRAILGGDVKNWNELGGADCAIVPINRSSASGVRSIVESRVLNNRSIAVSRRYAESNREAALAVKRTRGGFSYVALPAVRGLDIVPFAIDGVAPSNQNVLTGMYPFWACERVVFRREMHDLVLRFADHIVLGSDVSDLLGYINLNRMAIRKPHDALPAVRAVTAY
jgi:phosphate transport system substrate-binding protein